MCWVNAKSAGNGCRARMIGPPLSISQYSSEKDEVVAEPDEGAGGEQACRVVGHRQP